MKVEIIQLKGMKSYEEVDDHQTCLSVKAIVFSFVIYYYYFNANNGKEELFLKIFRHLLKNYGKGNYFF